MSEGKATRCFVGIDVSKDTLDIHARPSLESWKVENRDFEALITRLQALNPELIVLEATGGYETNLVLALTEAGLPVHREHPLKVHHHAKGRGKLAKTDRLDASTLAHYAECFASEITLRPLPPDNQRKLQQFIARRKQLVELRTAEINREQHPAIFPEIESSCTQLIEALNKQIKELESMIQQLIQEDEKWQRKQEILQSVAGIGETISSLLLVNLPELGSVNRKVIAALAGVAPYRYESGTFKGQQHIRGGRKNVRSALFMAALVAKKYNPEIKALYERLLKQGKRKKVALVACMHKLLRMLNAMLAKDELYGAHTA
jgi:transposase